MSETEFEKIFNGRIKPIDVPEPFRGVVMFALDRSKHIIETHRNQYPSFPDVYIDIVDDTRINASATVNKSGKFFIGINIGTLIIVQDVFLRMLSEKTILKDIGDVSKETVVEKVFSLQITDLDRFVAARPRELMIVIPKDPKRLLFAQTLMAIVIEFLVDHEYGHIVRGHVSYLNSKIKNFYLNEVPENDVTQKQPVDPLFSQTIEMDADGFATSLAMQKLYSLNYDLQTVDPLVREYYEDWSKIIRTWVFATYTFYKIIGHRVKATSSSFFGSHPTPSIRAFLSQINLNFILGDKNIGISKEEIRNICLETWDEVDQAFVDASQIEFEKFEMLFVTSKKAALHIDALLANWKSVCDLLQPFAFMPLIPSN